VLLGAWLSLALLVDAQPPVAPNATAPQGPAARGDGVQEAKPSVYYLRDKDGKLEPLLNYTLEEFERLLSAGGTRGAGQSRPSYRLNRVAARGTVKSERADLSIQFTVFIDDKDWVRVPLRLSSSVVHGPVKYAGPGEYFLEFDDESDEYVAWFRGASDKPHQLSLDVLVPVTTLAGETRLKLATPRAFNSELVLKVPGPKAVGQVSTGAVLESTNTVGDSTEFKVLGLTSDFSLAWRKAESHAAEIPAVLEANGGLLARIDGRSINTEAQLTIRSFGGEFESFRIRLPPGAILLTTDQPEYTLHALSPKLTGDKGSQDASRPVVEVRLRSRTTGPVRVRLVTEQTYDVAKKQQWIELAGFEVVGAVRQWGHLGVQVVGDWQVAWGKNRLVRQIEDLPAELWRENMLAGFEYFGQPFSLLAQVAPRETRVNVEPEYLVLVGANRVELEARLKYRVGGAKAFDFEVDMPGWQLDDVGPANRVSTEEIAAGELEPLKIPLRDAMLGDIEITVRAHRDLAAGAAKVDFALPRPLANGVGSAPVVVLPADNVDLTPRETDSIGLVRQHIRPAMKLPARQQPPLVYRSEGAAARFVAGLHVFDRRITVGVKTHVELTAEGGKVAQQFAYSIARESAPTLSLQVPTQLAEEGKLEINLRDQALTWQPVVGAEASVPDTMLVQVVLPPETIGLWDLTIRYPWTSPPPAPNTSASVQVPLVMPAEGDLTTNELTISAAEGVHFVNLDGYWQSPSKTNETKQESQTLVLSSDVPRSSLSLGLSLDLPKTSTATRVERAWIQTWLTDHARQDRAVYRLITPNSRFHLRLPAGAVLLQTLVNMSAVKPEAGATSEEWNVPLGERAAPDQPLTLEVDYHFPDRRFRLGEGSFELRGPELEKGTWAWRVYWLLILPRDEVLLAPGGQFTEESVWAWQGFGWGRQPALDQSQLETWSGAGNDPPPPANLHHYLFSAMGTDHILPVATMRLSHLVLGASGALLLLGLLVLYFPPVRHPLVLLVGALAFGAMAMLQPEIALVVGQAALLGLALLLVAVWLMRSASRRHGRMVGQSRVVTGPMVDRGSTQTHYRPSLTGSHTTTMAPTAIGAQFTGSESEP
jgi:hypothetical protein